MNSVSQDRDFEYFAKNMSSFYKEYGHKFLIIKGKKVLGVFDTFDDTVNKAMKKEKLGTFLIQECFPNKEAAILHSERNLIGPFKNAAEMIKTALED
ncbi:MAG: hypothetical protein LBT79_00230 [Elusimicrobiota bacterium]|jgi:fibrillarin-like rRNA methylase|nr:hypothetical protein [Elusimicrobiota bacterium]